MSLIKISNLTFCYEGSWDNIFENVSIDIDTDWRLGFCGRNGRGKTTLLRLLMGLHEYSGNIAASVKFEYFPMEIPDFAMDTLAILEQIAPNIELWNAKKELSKLEVDENILYQTFGLLSNGERTKVLLAALFLKENNFLLIDEPTNHLDLNARQVLARYLRSKSGFVLVSHDRFFLDECCDHILSINKNNIEILQGNYTTWVEQKKRQDTFEIAQNQKLEQDIDRLKKSARQTADWSMQTEKSKFGVQRSGLKADRGFVGHKAAKMMKRAKVIEKRQQNQIQEKESLLKNIERVDNLVLRPLQYHKERLLGLDNIAISYDDRKILDGFCLSIHRGDRINLQGKNGSGKSSILQMILNSCQQAGNQSHNNPNGLRINDSISTTGSYYLDGNMLRTSISCCGGIYVGSQLIVSYVPQDASSLSGSLGDLCKQYCIDESLLKAILHKLDFSSMQLNKDIENFSAGQKKKVVIARSLCEKAHLYIWDEPLNYIDILSRTQIENLITQYCPTMLFVEHDKAFVDKVATEIVVIEKAKMR